jgi:hypothetical protein
MLWTVTSTILCSLGTCQLEQANEDKTYCTKPYLVPIFCVNQCPMRSTASTHRLEVIPLIKVKIWTSSTIMYRQSTRFVQQIKSFSVANANIRKRATVRMVV